MFLLQDVTPTWTLGTSTNVDSATMHQSLRGRLSLRVTTHRDVHQRRREMVQTNGLVMITALAPRGKLGNLPGRAGESLISEEFALPMRGRPNKPSFTTELIGKYPPIQKTQEAPRGERNLSHIYLPETLQRNTLGEDQKKEATLTLGSFVVMKAGGCQ